jgi:hypothetical protein
LKQLQKGFFQKNTRPQVFVDVVFGSDF